jgi:hypothetical protein
MIAARTVVTIGQAMMGKGWGYGLFNELGPIAGLRIVLGADPNVGEHQLKHQHQKGCGEPHSCKNVEQAVLGAFLFVILYLKRRRKGAGGGSERGGWRLLFDALWAAP